MGIKRINKVMWTDARGVTKDIKELETSHITNIIALLQRRKIALSQVGERFQSERLVSAIMAAEAEIATFVEELNSRKDEED